MLSSDSESEKGKEVMWLPHLQLTTQDCVVLQGDSAWLSDTLINASQTLFKQQHPHFGGFQNAFGTDFCVCSRMH